MNTPQQRTPTWDKPGPGTWEIDARTAGRRPVRCCGT